MNPAGALVVQTRRTPAPERSYLSPEFEAEWERKRAAYAATVVDSDLERAAVAAIVKFAEVGTWEAGKKLLVGVAA